MKRYSGQKALYEAMQRSRRRRRRVGLLERLTPQIEKVGRLARSVFDRPKLKVRKAESAPEKSSRVVLKPPQVVERPEPATKANATQAWLRPKAVQFNAGRIEISLPWQLGVIIGLLVVVAILVIYQLGHLDRRARYEPGGSPRSGVTMPPAHAAQPSGADASGSEVSNSGQQSTTPGVAAGTVQGPNDHVIVLAQYAKKKDLELVQEFFAEHGVKTAIYSFATLRSHFAASATLDDKVVPKGEGFMLLCGPCANPDKPGTNGYALKKKIVELGAQYDAPSGYESFASHRFSDAYGMKVK